MLLFIGEIASPYRWNSDLPRGEVLRSVCWAMGFTINVRPICIVFHNKQDYQRGGQVMSYFLIKMDFIYFVIKHFLYDQ